MMPTISWKTAVTVVYGTSFQLCFCKNALPKQPVKEDVLQLKDG